MVSGSETVEISCPYCGEVIEIVVDISIEDQTYVEDCQVCCRPITMHVVLDEDGTPAVQVSQEDDV